jgi:hypothetical protein
MEGVLVAARFAASSTTAAGSGPVEEELRGWRDTVPTAPTAAKSTTEVLVASRQQPDL